MDLQNERTTPTPNLLNLWALTARRIAPFAAVLAIASAEIGFSDELQTEYQPQLATMAGIPEAQITLSAMSRRCHNEDIVGHRGSLGANPTIGPDENTVRSALRAYRFDADGSEGDWQPTTDHVWVQMHNRTVDNTTNGHGIVANMTAEQVSKLRTADGSKIPVLQDMIAVLQSHPGKTIQYELKKEGEPTTTELQDLVTRLKKAGVADRIVFSSFSRPILRQLHAIAPTMPTAQIYDKNKRPSIVNVPRYIDMLNLHYGVATPDYVAKAHHRGIEVSVRQMNSRSLWSKFLQRSRIKRPDQFVTDNLPGYDRWCSTR
jgi:glycerophosphoryl diester phosphodiesterase